MLNENLAESCILKERTLREIAQTFLADPTIDYQRESGDCIRIEVSGLLRCRYSDDLGCLIASQSSEWEWVSNNITGSMYRQGPRGNTTFLLVAETFPDELGKWFYASIEIKRG